MNFHEYIKKLRGLPEKKKLIIIAVVVVISALIMGFFWVKSAANSLSKLQSVNLPKLDMPQDAIDSLSDTAGEVGDGLNQGGVEEDLQTDDWETYTSDKYGFEIKYPSNFLPTIIDYKDSNDLIKNNIDSEFDSGNLFLSFDNFI